MKQLIKTLLNLAGYELIKKYPYNPQSARPLTKEHFFELYFSLVENPFFVQIGANDGITGDPIYQFVIKHKLKGICVEPQIEAFKKLQETYRNYPVNCINALIGDKPFYIVKGKSAWASFDKQRLQTRGEIEEIHPPKLSFKELVKDLEKIDFLQIDAEGYDYEILKELDFKRFKPQIINLESHYFDDRTRKECEALLLQNGYRFFMDKSDTCGYRIKK